jgi:hypothetical protein
VDHKLTEGIIFTMQFPVATVKKNALYVTEPNNIEDLKKRIKHEIRQITPEILQNVRDACYYRFAISQERDTRCPLTCSGFFFLQKSRMSTLRLFQLKFVDCMFQNVINGINNTITR